MKCVTREFEDPSVALNSTIGTVSVRDKLLRLYQSKH